MKINKKSVSDSDSFTGNCIQNVKVIIWPVALSESVVASLPTV